MRPAKLVESDSTQISFVDCVGTTEQSPVVSQEGSASRSVRAANVQNDFPLSDIDRGLPSVSEDGEVIPLVDNIAPLSSDTPQSFQSEMFLLLQFLVELQVMPKSKIKVAHLVTIKNFVFKIQKSHMDMVNDLIQLQKTLGRKMTALFHFRIKLLSYRKKMHWSQAIFLYPKLPK